MLRNFIYVHRYKDERLLISNDGTRISSSGNKHKLRIKSVIESDAGEYMCKASSNTGENSFTVTLTIQSKYERN